MLVFKFGGASVKDANGVINLAKIVETFDDDLVIVVSAFGKTTNKLETILNAKVSDKESKLVKELKELEDYHLEILNELVTDKNDRIYLEVSELFENLSKKLQDVDHEYYDYWYDQIVSIGELLSTKIVSCYLNMVKLNNEWLDARGVIITNNNYRSAKVNWLFTSECIKSQVDFNRFRIYITQGFIGGTKENVTTTLGREGSDYSGAILANILNAENLTFWKDVPGILNADPEYFDDTKRLSEISYQETVELAYYGAKIIHPKTIKPLQNKSIPLFVKSFIDPNGKGTRIFHIEKYKQQIPIFIVKHEQTLLSIVPRDFSFVVEERLGSIISFLSEHDIKINLLHHSAISISLCIDSKNQNHVLSLIERLQNEFKVKYNENLKLITIRHYDDDAIKKLTKDKEILLQHLSRHNAQFIVK